MFLLTFAFSMVTVLFMVSKKINIGISLLTGGTLLMLLNQVGAKVILNTYTLTFTSEQTISLALTIGLISILGHLLEVYGIMHKMIDSMEGMLRSAKATILIAPAVIGTLLVTGGALMSCPVVGSLGDRLELSMEKRASANLVFRHALYFIFPFSPPLILAAELGDFNIWDFIRIQFPIAITMYVLGYLFYIRSAKTHRPPKTDMREYLQNIKSFILFSMPIWISFVGALIFKLPFYVSLAGGIVVCRLLAIKSSETSALETGFFIHIKQGFKGKMVLAIIGIMFFKNVVNNFDDLYIYIKSLIDLGIPLELLIVVSAAVICFPLASTQPGIAILFPIILPMAPDYHTKLLYGMFIYTSSFLFYYISPLHMCQVLTLEYFNVDMKSLYKHYVPILPVTFLVMVGVYFLML